MNREVDKYLEKLDSPQKEICVQVREIILKTFPGIEEVMKWGVPTYENGKYYIVSLKDHVNLGFSMKGLSKDEQKRFVGSGKTMKAIKINSIAEFNEEVIVSLLKLVWDR